MPSRFYAVNSYFPLNPFHYWLTWGGIAADSWQARGKACYRQLKNSSLNTGSIRHVLERMLAASATTESQPAVGELQASLSLASQPLAVRNNDQHGSFAFR